ncbi:MAG: copper chaperone PCu(A)C [Burkholderiaceae bacterium]
MKLTSPESVRLVEASSPVAGLVEVHEMKMEGEVMRMRATTALSLPAGQTVTLKPGGYHIMMLDVKGAVKAGEGVPLKLVFEGADGKRFSQDVTAEARAMGMPGAGAMQGQHKH